MLLKIDFYHKMYTLPSFYKWRNSGLVGNMPIKKYKYIFLGVVLTLTVGTTFFSGWEIWKRDWNKIEISNAYTKFQKKLKLDTNFHTAVLQPGFFSLDFPGYIIGVEKGNAERVGIPVFGTCLDDSQKPIEKCFKTQNEYLSDKPELQEKIEKRLLGSGIANFFGYAKTVFVSHIVKFKKSYERQEAAGRAYRWKTCFLFNLYFSSSKDCGSIRRTGTKNEEKKFFKLSWDALVALRDDLEKLIDALGETHILVFSTGWNTPQWESFANYNDLYTNLKREAGAAYGNSFKPIFIGFSWNSFWPNLIGKIGVDIINKANDADEIGLIWGNLLIQKVLLPLKKSHKIKIGLIGHSFGARLLSRAAYSGHLLSDSQEKIDLLIGLQGAFPAERYVPNKSSEGGPYRNHSKVVENAFFTTSKYDKAVKISAVAAGLTKKTYIGAGKTLKKAKKGKYGDVFSFAKINDKGDFEDGLNCSVGKPILVDAGDAIKTNRPGTGGGAHSDIYDGEIGRFLWQIINECTILNQAPETN